MNKTMSARPANNTEQVILYHLFWCGATTPDDFVNKIWPTSKQPNKKRITVLRYLRVLVRHGVVEELFGEAFLLTAAGRSVCEGSMNVVRLSLPGKVAVITGKATK